MKKVEVRMERAVSGLGGRMACACGDGFQPFGSGGRAAGGQSGPAGPQRRLLHQESLPRRYCG